MAVTRHAYPIALYKHVPWGGPSGAADIIVYGVDWSTGTFTMQFRNEPGDGGDALITLSNATAGAQGISASYDPAVVHPVSGSVVGATTIRPKINESTLEALDLAADPARELGLFYDIHATVSGLGKFVLLAGPAAILPGVTQ